MSSAVSTVRSALHPHLPSPAHSLLHQSRRGAPPPLSLQKVQEASLADEAALHTGGLRTPPAEDSMSTAYHHANHVLASTYNSLGRQPQSRTGGAPCEAVLNPRNPPQHQQHQFQHQPQLQSQPPSAQQIYYASTIVANPHPHSASSRHSTRPSTPSSTATSHVHSEGGTVSRRDSTMVMHSLQLPSCISPNGGNLDDFAALMTCFFWFENIETIQAAEQIKVRQANLTIPPLAKHTRPCADYKKWVNSILTTTQVTQNVVLLALLFVYRLKCTNPKVNGSPGSEYRLLTVALMLGNKFLDDNTYTNKTWAEVSGIAVKEIHVMEVEFLSNMRYGLLTSKEQWAEWLQKLSCFHEYCERAEMSEQAELRRRQAPMAPLNMSPTHRFSSPIPSPTGILPAALQGTSSSLTVYSPNTVTYNGHQNWHGQYQPTPSVSPLAAKPNLGLGGHRKRSLERPELVEPAPKRINRQVAATLSATGRQPAESVRLPIPQLTLDIGQAATSQAGAYPPPSSHTQGQVPASVSLPPIGSGIRAMTSAYQNATTWAPQMAVLATCGPQTPSYTAPSSFGTPTKRQSPSGLTVYGSSPLTEPFNTHTPISNSPSVYLQQRNSPYKPVRPVNTLNYPPPSIPLSEYHLGSAQMHYQPLGRRNVRTGIVPDFLPGYSGRPTGAGHYYP